MVYPDKKTLYGVKQAMNHCKYLMTSGSTFCRLKGKENPKCDHCSLRTENERRKTPLSVPGWLRIS
jgi:hypothetical protein